MLKKITIVLFAGAFLAGCNMTSRMEMPTIHAVQAPAVSPSAKMSKIVFIKAVAKLKRGQVIGTFPASMGNTDTNATLCNYRYQGSDNTIEWATGTAELSGWAGEFAEMFNDSMSGMGFDVAATPGQLFNVSDAIGQADLHIGAQVLDIRSNFCEEHHWWNGRPEGRYSGEAYAKVRWEVYSPSTQEVVGRFESEGYYVLRKPKRSGIMQTYLGAWAAAAEGLAADPGFLKLVMSEDLQGIEWAPSAAFESISLTGSKPRSGPIKNYIDSRINGVVRIRGGLGHGSGFAISNSGFLLTNAHVVGDRDTVTVIFRSGIQLSGDVLRRDKIRDVALVKVNLGGIPALPIDARASVQRLDKVTAIGAPKKENLHSTVTQGVVSAIRMMDKERLTFIQADVDIHGGNSGGPLLNESGNVIGISVRGISAGGSKLSAGLNFFIPIQDAMDAMKIKLATR